MVVPTTGGIVMFCFYFFFSFWICIFSPLPAAKWCRKEKRQNTSITMFCLLYLHGWVHCWEFFTYTSRWQNYQVTLKSYQFPHDLRQVMPPDYTHSLNRNEKHQRQSYRPHRPFLITLPSRWRAPHPVRRQSTDRQPLPISVSHPALQPASELIFLFFFSV